MLFSSLVVGAVATTAKWLMAAKIMTAVGTGCVAAAPAVEKLKNEKRKRRR